MKYFIAVATLCIGLSGGSVRELRAADNSQVTVRSSELKSVRVPGKVTAAIWTLRAGECTLQIVFPSMYRMAQLKPGGSARPEVQVWLLRADGTLIQPTRRADPRAEDRNMRHPYGIEVLFGFPLSADREAVAAAVRIDDAYFIERLAPL